ncbi:MAG: hypothetical protein AAGI72_21210 [Pseudomonadota bacterium]
MHMPGSFKDQPITEEMLSVAREIGDYQRTAELRSGRASKARRSQRSDSVDASSSHPERNPGARAPSG